jgi:hypothetical protein
VFCSVSILHKPVCIMLSVSLFKIKAPIRFSDVLYTAAGKNDLSFHLPIGFPSGRFPSGFPTKILHAFLLLPCVLHALPFSSSFTWSLWFYLSKNTSYEAPRYAVFLNRLPFHSSSVKIFFSAPNSQTPSAYICLSVCRSVGLSVCRSLWLMAVQPLWRWPPFNFLNIYTVGRTPWTGDQPIARPLPTHRLTQTQTTMPRADSSPRSQCSSRRRRFMS